MKRILFIVDKIELRYFEFNNLVTDFWLIKEFLHRGNFVCVTTIPQLYLKANKAYVKCYETFLDKENIFYKNILNNKELDSFDLIMFRPDPPVNIDYINATYIFDFVNTKVINSPKVIRSFNEKLHSLLFNEYMPDSLVTSSAPDIIEFLSQHKQIVLKPLNQCFGNGVMYLREGDPNTNTIIKNLTSDYNSLIMVQEYISDVKNGDKRILTLGDKVLPYCIKKLPGNNDFKFNTHKDEFIIKYDLSDSEIEYFTPIAKKLYDIGIDMAGLDVINNKIIEINVTSPCYFIKEINNAYGINLESIIADYLLMPALLRL